MSQEYSTEFRIDRFSEVGSQEIQTAIEQYEEEIVEEQGFYEFNVHQAHEFDCNAKAEITFVNTDECKKHQQNGFAPGMCDVEDLEDDCVIDVAGDYELKAKMCGSIVRPSSTTQKSITDKVTTEDEGMIKPNVEVTTPFEEKNTEENTKLQTDETTGGYFEAEPNITHMLYQTQL